jgi:hypothetical protein
MSYTIRHADSPAAWQELFNRVEHPHTVQSWAYGEGKRAFGWCPRRVVIERDREPVAICQVLDKRIAGVCVASRINRGPMLLDDHDVAGVYATLRKGWRFLLGGLLLIAPALPPEDNHRCELRAAGYRPRRDRGWRSAYLDLQLSAQQLRKNLSAKWRNHLNASERNGLAFRASSDPDDLEWLLARHDENMREKGFNGPATSFIRNLHDADEGCLLVCKAYHGNEPVAGLATLSFGCTAEYYVSWYGNKGRKLYAGNFLLWNTVPETKRRGFRYPDLGGYSEGKGYATFKRAMGGVEYELMGEWLCL